MLAFSSFAGVSMSLNPFPPVFRGFRFVWRALDATRRLVLNVLFLLIVLLVLYVLFGGSSLTPLPAKTTLVLDLKGQLVEQHSGSVRETLMSNVRGDAKKTVQMRDVLTVLDAAATDASIGGVVLLLDEMQGGGLASLREVAGALDRFRESGKPVLAWGSSFDQRQYMVAAHASELYMHPMGVVLLDGFGRYRNYYRDALDKIGITVNLMRVGTYKSFAEPYIANGPSPAATEAESYLNNALWDTYTSEVEAARKLPQGQLMAGINNLTALMSAASGDLAKVALVTKLVDGLKTRDQIKEILMARGAIDSEGKSFRQISFNDYLARQHPKTSGAAVGVIVAVGEISDGIEGPGAIGGLSTSNLIRQAREDAQIKSIVLRIDSPGGSAFGSELIRRELELTRAAGKPVVVSMGSVAASGGYWISMASDEVIADEATITGSIGVFAILPTAEKVVDKLGIHTAGVPTTWLGDAGNPLRALDPRFGQAIQSSVNHIYADFTNKAAKARNTTPEAINEVAQGRVWTGPQAKERGLVDRIGNYNDALDSAAERAKLDSGYRVSYIEPESSRFERAISLFGIKAGMADVIAALGFDGISSQVRLGLAASGLPPHAALGIVDEFAWLADLSQSRKPFMALTHCLCTPP
jgi:protease-4